MSEAQKEILKIEKFYHQWCKSNRPNMLSEGSNCVLFAKAFSDQQNNQLKAENERLRECLRPALVVLKESSDFIQKQSKYFHEGIDLKNQLFRNGLSIERIKSALKSENK